MTAQVKQRGLSPLPEETLMSFLFRVSEDAFLDWRDFQREVIGVQIGSARKAERRSFDWRRLSETLALPPDQLFAMTERSFFLAANDTSRLTNRRLAVMPWSTSVGYPAYSPAALQRSEHIRLGWLRPDAIVDQTSGTLFLRHCFDCGIELAGVPWQYPKAFCPRCTAPLITAPRVKASPKIIDFISTFSTRLEAQYRHRPVNYCSDALVHFAAVWHVANAFRSHKEFWEFAGRLAREAGFGAVDIGPNGELCDASAEAQLHAQLIATADHACRQFPAITRRFRKLMLYPRNLPNAPSAIRKGIEEAIA